MRQFGGICMRHVIVLQVPSSLSCDSGPDILATWADRRSAILAFIQKIRLTAVAIAGLVTVALCLVQPSGALAANASDMFADGNRLFRDDLYWAALLRYQQAGEAGMNTPLLHYNTGIAHYRAQQHSRARESLQKAAREPRLRAIAHYNLGLNSYAANDFDDALLWFRMARDQHSNKKISEYAVLAIARLQRTVSDTDRVMLRAADRKEPRELFQLDVRARVSVGNDSNVFRSPSESYVDLSDPNTPTVNPVVQSGLFTPYDFWTKYSVNSLKHELFYGAYRFSGRLYQDTVLGNADEYRHELRFGNEYHRREGSRERKIFSAFAIAQHHDTYFDPDDGSERVAGGQSISGRMSYLRYGPELWFRQSYERFSFGGRLKAQLWNYEDVETVPEYDHEYILLGLNAQYRFTQSSLLRITADAYARRFGDRPSFELDGRQLLGNPPIEYEYLQVGLTARQRIGDRFWFGFDYFRTEREDTYLGYNNYTRNTYQVNVSWRPGRKLRLEASAYYRVYDFENAFAFHNPGAGRKTLESVNSSLVASYGMAWNLTLVAQYNYRQVDSNDTRIAYDRSQYVIGLMWQH